MAVEVRVGGVITLSPSGSIELNCRPDWSVCAIDGCLTVNADIDVPSTDISLPIASVSICVAYHPLVRCRGKTGSETINSLIVSVGFGVSAAVSLNFYNTVPDSYKNDAHCMELHGWSKGYWIKILAEVEVDLAFFSFVVFNSYIYQA